MYDGPSAGLAEAPDNNQVTAGIIVTFDQNQSDAYTKMVNATTNPDTIPLPNITFEYVNAQTKKDVATVQQAKTAVENAQKAVNAAQNELNQAKKSLL